MGVYHISIVGESLLHFKKMKGSLSRLYSRKDVYSFLLKKEIKVLKNIRMMKRRV